jgi:hypothetical protein
MIVMGGSRAVVAIVRYGSQLASRWLVAHLPVTYIHTVCRADVPRDERANG